MTDAADDPPPVAYSDSRRPDRPVALDCEHALLGAVLRAETIDEAATVLDAVVDEDFAQPRVRDAVALARAAVAEGVLPVPSVLLARLSTAHGMHKWKLLAVLFVDAWWAGPPPIAAWSLVLAVLEASYRRAVRDYASRVRQASYEPLDVVPRVLRDMSAVSAVEARLVAARRGPARKVRAA